MVDDRRGFVGSFNLDPRSAYLNTEMGVLFDDPVLGARCATSTCAWPSPEQSYWLTLDAQDGLRWLERGRQPPCGRPEPDSLVLAAGQRACISWLPMESQL